MSTCNFLLSFKFVYFKTIKNKMVKIFILCEGVMPTFRIISFDGGGVRGALSTRLFKRITDRYPMLIKHTDMFAGTSTGSFIALALAYNKTPTFIDNFYNYNNMKYVFTPEWHGLFRPRFSNTHLRHLLLDVFPPQLSLSSLGKYTFIPSFNVKGYTKEGYEIVFFTNLINNPTITEKVIDVALYSSAAPTYFPSVNNFIDGGVVANSPTTAPLLYVRSVLGNTYKIPDFRILSIGTGYYPAAITQNTSNWGLSQWSVSPLKQSKSPLLSILLEDPVQLETLYANELLHKNFFRLNPDLPKAINLADYKEVPRLKSLADETDLSATFDFIENHFLK